MAFPDQILLLSDVFIMFIFQSLSMNNSARVESTVGEMVNLMSVDAEHIRHIYTQGWGFVACPLSIIISLVFLYYEVSRSGVFLINGLL